MFRCIYIIFRQSFLIYEKVTKSVVIESIKIGTGILPTRQFQILSIVGVNKLYEMHSTSRCELIVNLKSINFTKMTCCLTCHNMKVFHIVSYLPVAQLPHLFYPLLGSISMHCADTILLHSLINRQHGFCPIHIFKNVLNSVDTSFVVGC